MDEKENKNTNIPQDETPENELSPESLENAADNAEVNGVVSNENDENVSNDVKEIENDFHELVAKMTNKNEEDILKSDVQDWDGLVDNSKQDAQEFVLNESSFVSDEKLESIEVMEIDEDDERLCSICHKRLKMTVDGVTYEYCRRCRNELLETKYNPKSVIAFLVSCVVFVFAVALGATAVLNGINVSKAQKLVDKSKLNSAYNLYSAMFSSADETVSSYAPLSVDTIFGVNLGEKSVKSYVDTMYKLGNVQYIGDVVDKYFKESELNKKSNSKLKKYKETFSQLRTAATSANAIITDLQASDEITKSEVEKAVSDLENLKKEGKYNNAFISYYQYYAYTLLDGEYENQLKYLDIVKKGEPELTVFYRTAYANVYLCQGEYEKCIKECDEAIKENEEDFSAWRIKIKALYRQGKYDEAMELSDKAINVAKAIYETSDQQDSTTSKDITYAYSIYVEKAIVNVLKGDMKSAQDAIDKAYQGQLTADTAFVYAMISKKNGNTEAYDDIMSQLETYKVELPEVCKEFIDGKTTFEDIFVKGKVEWY